MPRTIGVIMDGNRRWARLRGRAPFAGHKEGYARLKKFLEWAKEASVETVIVYGFSTENWHRSKKEVTLLLSLFHRMVIEEADEMKKEKIRVRFVGDIAAFPASLQKGIRRLEEETKIYKDRTLAIAAPYGGRAEIAAAAQKIVKEVRTEKSIVREADIEKHLWTSGIPDPDMIIRTGGEMRLSNFLLWQAAYSELFFTKTLWPDFSRAEFKKMIEEFAMRARKYGV